MPSRRQRTGQGREGQTGEGADCSCSRFPGMRLLRGQAPESPVQADRSAPHQYQQPQNLQPHDRNPLFGRHTRANFTQSNRLRWGVQGAMIVPRPERRANIERTWGLDRSKLARNTLGFGENVLVRRGAPSGT
jgi:hypothetical protein